MTSLLQSSQSFFYSVGLIFVLSQITTALLLSVANEWSVRNYTVISLFSFALFALVKIGIALIEHGIGGLLS